MPMIIIRASFHSWRRKILDKKEVFSFLSPKFKAVASSTLSDRLKKIYVWDKNPNGKVATIMTNIMGTFAIGDLDESTTLGIFDSIYEKCIEFWICSSKSIDCVKGREYVRRKLRSIRRGIYPKIEIDTLVLEGGNTIAREGTLSRYVRGDFHVGFLIALATTLLTSIYEYVVDSTKAFNWTLPLLFLLAWLVVFIGELIYNKGKGVYIVKK
jgi:hypothetical protein